MADRAAARRAAKGAAPDELGGSRAPTMGPIAVSSLELDRLIHERVRLAIVSALAVAPTLGFTELKGIVGATDGNLSVHARKLELAGYLACRKSFRGRTPHTEYSLTERGRAALDRYLDHMEGLIRAMKPRVAGRRKP